MAVGAVIGRVVASLRGSWRCAGSLVALCATATLFMLASADAALARPAYGWQGTVSIDASEQYNDGIYAARTLVKASFSDLAVVDGAYAVEQRYSANATMTFEQHDIKACAEGVPPSETLHRTWTFPGGRTLDPQDDNSLEPRWPGGVAFTLFDQPGALYFVLGRVFMWMPETSDCTPDPGSVGTSYAGYGYAYTDARPTRPLADTDPRPDWVVGTTTYTLAAPPHPGADDVLSAYSYTITYRLQRLDSPPCRNRVDDDGDGLIDLIDPGCSGAADTSELGPWACDDGIDNDADGLTDALDRGCSGPTDTDERATLVVRVDGPGEVRVPSTGGVCTETCVLEAGAGGLDLEVAAAEPHPDATRISGCASTDGVRSCHASAPTDRDVVIDVRFDPVVSYAPRAVFHRDEKHWPMDPDDFIRHSKLAWANDDHLGCRKSDVDKVARGKINPRDLRLGERAKYRHTLCFAVLGREVRQRFTTADLTAPSETAKQPRGGGRWGFYLNLDDAYHHGVEPANADDYVNAPQMVVEYKPHRYITYWFFSAKNNVKVATVDDMHEGDWERIAVRLDKHNRATHVAYWQHYCQPKAKYGSLLTWQQMTDRGYLYAGVHPNVYVARGAHASYPNADDLTVTPCETKNGLLDHHGGRGVTWKTWQNGSSGFAEATKKPWYGFGGGWGSRDEGDSGFWGPLGPGPMKPPVPASWK